MEIKNVIAFLIILSFNFSSKGQNLKTYNGSYIGGTANYQYYESSIYERILHGNFYYKRKNPYPTHSENEITGFFKENLKSGLWSAKKERTAIESGYGFLVIKETSSGKYEKGKKIGEWSFKSEKEFGNKNEIENAIFNFKENILVGTINTSFLKGHLTDDGLFIGNWNLTTYDNYNQKLEYIALFKSNIFIKLIVRRCSDGEILFRYDNSDFINQLQDINSEIFPIINGQKYEFKAVSGIDIYSNEDCKYFKSFSALINEKLRNIDEPVNEIELGSTDFIIKIPQVLIKKELSPEENQAIRAIAEEQRRKEEEGKRIVEENARIERERLEAVAKKEKCDATIKNGDRLYEAKKYREALSEYKSANAIESSSIISAKIKSAQDEIDKIIQLQKLRYETYAYLWNGNSTLMMDWLKLKNSLESKKKVYGDNYEKCMNLLSTNFSSYFSIANTPKRNITNASTVEENWNETDQAELDLLLKLKEEMKACEKFHYKVLKANINDDKEQLKLLRSSDNPKEIIAKF